MKIKEEQLKIIQDQQEKLNELIHNIGLLESQKHGLLHEIAKVNVDVQESKQELEERCGNVLTIIYLLFNEGYYSSVTEKNTRKHRKAL